MSTADDLIYSPITNAQHRTSSFNEDIAYKILIKAFESAVKQMTDQNFSYEDTMMYVYKNFKEYVNQYENRYINTSPPIP